MGTGSTILADSAVVWVKYNMTATDIYNNIALTRHMNIAKKQNT